MTTTYAATSERANVPSSTTGDAGSPARWLVRGGAAAGPLFIAASIAQAVLRDGASFSGSPPSALSNGDLGWMQIVTFVTSGLLMIGAAAGLRGGLHGPGATWGPRLLGVFGLGFVGGGVFTMDPAFGFPPGTPAGKPDVVTWHGALHGLVFALAFFALIAAGVVFARRYRSLNRPTMRCLSVAIGPVALVLTAWPNFGEADGRFLPLWLGVTASLVWTSVVLADAGRDL